VQGAGKFCVECGALHSSGDSATTTTPPTTTITTTTTTTTQAASVKDSPFVRQANPAIASNTATLLLMLNTRLILLLLLCCCQTINKCADVLNWFIVQFRFFKTTSR
jgi:hypothetical protein